MLEEWRETQDNRAARSRIARRLSQLWRCRFAEAPEGKTFHFKGVDVPVIMQIKVSTPSMAVIDREGGVYRSKDQWQKNHKIVRDDGNLIYTLVVVTADNYWATATQIFDHDGTEPVAPKGREGARNDSSNVVCVMLRKRRFKPVSPERPWLRAAQRPLF